MSIKSFSKAAAVAAFVAAASLPGVSYASEIEDAVAAADASAGQSIFRRCMGCHTAEEDGPNRVGPNLWGVVGRERGSVEGFRYSRPMAAAEGSWTLESLNSFLENPRGFLPGTTMGFAGLRGQDDRNNLLAYLNSLGTSE